MLTSDFGAKIIAAVAGACVIGGGTMVLRANEANAVQDTRLSTVETSIDKTLLEMREQTRQLAELNVKLERLIARSEQR